MKSSIISNSRPLLRALYVFVIAIGVLWALPRNAHAQLYVTQFYTGVVSEYSASTGEMINAQVITGLNGPYGLLVRGNTLFVADSFGGAVRKYNANTGFPINANFITGLHKPAGLAVIRTFLPPVLGGNFLFVANETNGTVGKYDANNGAVINASFITGLSFPFGLAFNEL